MIKKYKANFLIKNTLILISSSLIIKALSLLNRIVITRLLGQDGISLYVLTLPTIMLLCSISGFSLNITLSKITAENEKTNEYTRKQILKVGIYLGLYATILTSIVFILLFKFIVLYLLKQSDCYYPLLISLTMIPFSMLNGVYRGFYNGLDNIKTSSNSALIEQIGRMIFSTLLLLIFSKKGLIVSVSISVFSMTIGEICSLLYNIFKVKKVLNKTCNNINPLKNLEKKIFTLSFSETLSHLVINLSFFLEPIIYTYVLGKINISQNEIMYHYSEVNAYALPLLTMFIFTSSCIATVIIPTISKNNYNNNSKVLTENALRFSLIPGILLGIILYFYGDKYMYFLYKSTSGSYFVRNYSLIFVLFYINPVLLSVLQAHGKQKNILIISICCCAIKLLLILSLTFIKEIGYKSLFYSVIIINIINTLIYYIYTKKLLKIKIQLRELVKMILFFGINFYIMYILKYLKLNFIISSLVFSLIYIVLVKLFILKDISLKTTCSDNK